MIVVSEPSYTFPGRPVLRMLPRVIGGASGSFDRWHRRAWPSAIDRRWGPGGRYILFGFCVEIGEPSLEIALEA
jgi:hypothetical protein